MKMASTTTTLHWRAQNNLSTPNHAGDWKEFYIRAIDYLEPLDIDVETPDGSKRGWKQVKFIFQEGDKKTLQT